MILGLCCLRHSAKDYKFRIYTRAKLEKLTGHDAKACVHGVIWHNVRMLAKFFNYCREAGIASYRLSSDLIPHFKYITSRGLVTENELQSFLAGFAEADSTGLSLSFHPGQHVALGSPRSGVLSNSIDDLRYHKLLQDALRFKEMNIHLGGAYGDKEAALSRFRSAASSFKDYLTVENDELTFSIDDCLTVARSLNIPVTFDLHHHRCYSLKKQYEPAFTEHQYFLQAKQTWINSGRDYMRIHISSPRGAYTSPSKSRPHADFITASSIPEWLLEEAKKFPVCVDVEAKAKEKAIFQLAADLNL